MKRRCLILAVTALLHGCASYPHHPVDPIPGELDPGSIEKKLQLRADLAHLLELYDARHERDITSESFHENIAFEDLGSITVSDRILRLVYYVFNWSTSSTEIHGTTKILIFSSSDGCIGSVYLHAPIDLSRTHIRGKQVEVVFENGEKGDVTFAEGLSPETKGDFSMGLFHSE